jgi:hypothetical protein
MDFIKSELRNFPNIIFSTIFFYKFWKAFVCIINL